ncbi:MAG: rhodanese-like domain-containing protein [Pelovirga sp.]
MRYKPLVTVLLSVLSVLFAVGLAFAQSHEIPDLRADEVKSRLDQKQEILVVDVRTAEEYDRGHISGAVNISSPATRQFRDIARLLPEDRAMPLVFYCRGYS